MEETIEKRLSDLEAVITDMPEIMNLRFERIDATSGEVNGRLALLDKQMAALIRDVRDLRGGVTRLAADQERRLNNLSVRVERLEAVVGSMAPRVEHLEAVVVSMAPRVERLEARLGAMDARIGEAIGKLDEVLRRIPKAE